MVSASFFVNPVWLNADAEIISAFFASFRPCNVSFIILILSSISSVFRLSKFFFSISFSRGLSVDFPSKVRSVSKQSRLSIKQKIFEYE